MPLLSVVKPIELLRNLREFGHPQTSGKAERVIQTILQMRMSKQSLPHGMMVNSAWPDSLTSIIR